MNVRDEFLPEARELLDLFGSAATITRAGVAVAPSASQKFDKAARTKPVPVTIATVAVLIEPEEAGNDAGARTAKSVVVMLDQPIEGDTLTLGDTIYRIGKVKRTAPQGEAIYYEAEVS